MCLCSSSCSEDQDAKAVVLCFWRRGDLRWFPRNKRLIDGYARCMLCRADLSIAGRGLSSLWDHWKGVEHTRLEKKYRIMTHKPLLDKSCRPVSAEEDRRIRRARLTEPPVFLESALKLTVEERIAIEEAEAEEDARPHLQDESVNYLWLSNFVSSFLNVTLFRVSCCMACTNMQRSS